MKINPVEKVHSYFIQLGISPELNESKFWQTIQLNHGNIQFQKLVNSMNERSNNYTNATDIYEIKNETLPLSLDFTSMTADFLRGFLEWFTNFGAKLTPSKILEIGCDNGVTACFLALFYPNAEVIGIDMRKNGINRARELAKKLDLKKIQFISTDFKDYSQETKNEFDLIISLRTMHEMLDSQEMSTSFTTNEFIESLNLQADPILNSIQGLLKDDESLFISCERLSSTYSVAFYSELLQKSNLFIDWDHVLYNHSHQFDTPQNNPIFVTKSKRNEYTTFDGLVQLAKNRDKEPNINGVLAEVFMKNFQPHQLEGGVQINSIHSGEKFRMECWSDSEHAYLYKYDNLGYHEIFQYPAEEIDEVLYEMEMLLLEYAPPNSTIVFDYETIQEREELI